MIVNPQLFNYRLISGSLIVAIAVLSIYSFTNFQSAKSHQQFLENEQQLITTELSQMLLQYEDITVSNDQIALQLDSAKNLTKIALDSIGVLKGDIAVYSKYKRQLAFLRSENVRLFKAVDSLSDINHSLEKDKANAIVQLREKQAENKTLKEENVALSAKVEIGSKLYINNFAVKAYSLHKGQRTETRRATNAENIEVCLTLTENVLTSAGKKELYIQIVNPKNNVVADKGAVSFGEAQLIYSAKNTVYYDNMAKDICVNVKADPKDKPLEKGLYYVNVFHNETKIAGTKIILD